jgi:hypothetical protein
MMAELYTGSIKRNRAHSSGFVFYLISWDEIELRDLVDKSLNKPWTGHPINLHPLSGYPFHFFPFLLFATH